MQGIKVVNDFDPQYSYILCFGYVLLIDRQINGQNDYSKDRCHLCSTSIPLVHHLSVQAVALLLHEHLFVHALDPRLTISQVGLKAPNPLLNLPTLSHQAGRHHLKLQLRHQPLYVHSLAGLDFFVFFLNLFSSSFYFKFLFYSIYVFINLKRCSFTKLPESTDQFSFMR